MALREKFISYFPDHIYDPNLIKKIPSNFISECLIDLDLPHDAARAEIARIYFYQKEICGTCGGRTKLISFNQGFRKYCSAKCSNNSDEVIARKKKSSLDKYGTEYPNQNKSVKDKIKKKLVISLDEKKLIVSELIAKQGYEILSEGNSFSDSWRLKCQCGEEFERVLPTWSRWNTGWKTICPKCSHGSSHEEKQLANWIEEQGVSINRRDRKVIAPLELDIFIPELNLAIEYNGLYWHADDRERHFKKFKMCYDRGIKLIQIFEHEWWSKPDQIKSRLKSALGLNIKIFARKTKVEVISSDEAKAFLEVNHLHGFTRGACLHLGLKINDKILQVISIGKSRFNKKYDFEILRSASVEDITIVGGLSKLIHAARKMLNGSILTYADLCWGTGDSYAKAGGTFIKFTDPGYVWWKKDRILSRYETMKKNLPNIVENYSDRLTQEENMRRDGWRQVWNAGNAIYCL